MQITIPINLKEKEMLYMGVNYANVKQEHGTPVLFVNGKKTPPVFYSLSDFRAAKSDTAQAQRNIKAFSDCGIDLVCCDTNLCTGWHRVSGFDIAPLRAELSGVLDANPMAKIVLRLHVNPPYWWLRDHPEECIVYRTDKGDIPGIDDGESDRLIKDDLRNSLRCSFASELWLKEAGDMLRLFCEQIQNFPEGDALIGIQVAYGVYGEWHQFGVDCSLPMQRYFRIFLKEKYDSEKALQQSWKNTSLTFDTAEFHPETHQRGDDGHFRDPMKSQNIIDAQQCIQMSGIRAILHFCKIIKQTFARQILTGVFYGYYFGCGSNGEYPGTTGNNAPIIGHLNPHLLYAQKEYLDFLSGPFAYLENRFAEGVPLQRGILESARLNGLLWLTEMDQAPFGSMKHIGGDPEHISESIAVLRRNILQPFVSGHGAWYYDHRVLFTSEGVYRKHGWWENSTLLDEIKSMQKLMTVYSQEDYVPQADVLFVVDTEQYYYRSRYTDELYWLYEGIARCSVGIDCIYLQDLENCDFERYRCVVFANTFVLTGRQRKWLQENHQGKQMVFLYASGYCDTEKLNLDYMNDLLGMHICKHTEQKTVQTHAGEPFQLRSEILMPQFAVQDGYHEAVLWYEDGAVCGARKNNLWYFAHNLIPAPLWEKIINISGAHRYTTSREAVLVGNGLLVCCANAGEREIIFPSGNRKKYSFTKMTTAVWDLITEEIIL